MNTQALLARACEHTKNPFFLCIAAIINKVRRTKTFDNGAKGTPKNVRDGKLCTILPAGIIAVGSLKIQGPLWCVWHGWPLSRQGRNKRKEHRRQTIRARGDDPTTQPLSWLWVGIMVQYKEKAGRSWVEGWMEEGATRT